jgi:hypothetical protein
MNTLKFIALLFLFQTKVFAQEKSVFDLKEIFANTLVKHRQAYLYEKIDSNTVKFIKKNYLSGKLFKGNKCSNLSKYDTLTITDSERNVLDSLLGVSEKNKWNKADIERYGMLNLTIVDKAMYDKRNSIDQNVYEVMLPIFIRKNTICFTFYMIYCKGWCSIGEIVVHKKINGKWQRWIQVASFQR